MKHWMRSKWGEQTANTSSFIRDDEIFHYESSLIQLVEK